MNCNQLLFYGGIALAAVTLVLGAACLAIYKVKTVRLEAQLDYEYGKPEKPHL